MSPQKAFGSFKPSSRRSGSSLSDSAAHPLRININSDPFRHRIEPYLKRLWQSSRMRHWISRCRHRLHRSPPIVLVALALAMSFCGLVLLFHVGFFSGKKYQDWETDHADSFEEIDLLDKVYPEDGRSQSTAIIVLQDGLSAMDALPMLDQLCQFDMFAQILVWDELSLSSATDEMVRRSFCRPGKIRVYVPPERRFQAARYFGCALAATPYCYFKDRPGDLQHLRSVYANFLRSPHLPHTVALDPRSYMRERWEWCYFNFGKYLDVHVCQATVGSGTFVSRTSVEQLVTKLEQQQIQPEEADMSFFILQNQVPYQLELDSSASTLDVLTSPSSLAEAKAHTMDALSSLYHALQTNTNDTQSQLITEAHPNLQEQTSRSPCLNDRCIFMTNMDVFPDFRLFPYTPDTDMDVIQRQRNDQFDSNRYLQHPYTYAVDESDDTAWMTTKYIQAGDYIGLDLLMPMRTALRFRLLARHPDRYHRTLVRQISHDGVVWTNTESNGYTCEVVEEDDVVMNAKALLACQFMIHETGYRFMRLMSKWDLDFSMEVYDLSFDAKVRRPHGSDSLDIRLDMDPKGDNPTFDL